MNLSICSSPYANKFSTENIFDSAVKIDAVIQIEINEVILLYV